MIKLVNLVYIIYYANPKKFIIAGDPFQIEPIVEIDTWKNENIYTMVGLNSFSEPRTEPIQYPVKLLTTQYRSVPEIGQVFSHLRYDGILKHFRSANSQRSLPILNEIELSPVNFIKFPVSNYESIYRPKRLQQKSVYHIYSALLAFEFIKKIASSFKSVIYDNTYKLGLITPYRAQSDLIDRLTSAETFPKSVEIQVGTVHGFQGDECNLLIVLFNPPPYISDSKLMFLNKLNIINVSISRARDYVIILMPDDNTQNINNLSYIKFIERFCKKNNFCSEWQSFEIEDFLFNSKTYLEDNVFSTSHQQVNVYGEPEMLYEIRSENNALDVQLHPKLKK
ncbi:MAG: C-terminal helicase domain-containing protein [Deltaproteobacteria bacterium]|jgi:superfamily I DNA and/or RNA helicase|nr:C-terminal helicase domain-containing protein [Deltaproteobacteria bacterium]